MNRQNTKCDYYIQRVIKYKSGYVHKMNNSCKEECNTK